MSHITTSPVRIFDLDALASAARQFGGEMQKKNTYVWFGTVMNPEQLPPGMKKEDVGKCDYAIKIPGINYEIGVVRQKDGSFSLAYDFWGAGRYGYEDARTPGAFHDGEKLKEKLGDNLCRLSQAYGVSVVERQARKKGWMLQKKTLSNGSVQLVMMQA